MSVIASRLILLANETARAQIYPERGFQLFSFQVKRGHDWVETIYAPLEAREPTHRRYGNPVLFPAVGVSNTAEPDTWSHGGKTLPMPSHGWARNVYWQVEQISQTAITAVLVPHPGFHQVFPFNFELRLTYSLQGSQLVLEGELRNHGELAFPYAFGLHPYLRMPLGGGGAEGCCVQLPSATRLRSGDGWRTMTAEPFAAQTLAITDSQLPRSIVLTNTGTNWLEARDERVGLATRVCVEGSEQSYPVWVAWTAGGEDPYLCLEPWTDAPNALNRDDTRKLGPAQTHRYRMSLSLRQL